MNGSRDHWLLQSDDNLLRQCQIDTYRASGPGGQKRNKTSSAVRLRHKPSGLLAIAEESRSQHENKAKALRRLRMAIALEIRVESSAADRHAVVAGAISSSGGIAVPRRSPDRPRIIAHVIDEIAAHGGRIQMAAASIGVTTSQLSKFVCDDGKVLAAVNRIRSQFGIGPLTQRE
ncbi:MAG: peptide chain release factor-like protein [Phycisphaerae bacterium]|nr:peptide chain release factor-like protein [Phycisphaerae bacterium]